MTEETEVEPGEKTEEKKESLVELVPKTQVPIEPWLKNTLFSVLGVFVLAGVVFGAYKFGQRQVKPGPQPTPTPVVVATPTPDPTVNWKTYTNTKYGYSIKHPNKWQAREVREGPEAGIRIDFAEIFTERQYWVWVKVNDNPDGFSAKQWVNRLLSQYSDQPAVIAGIKREKESVADVEAERVTGLPAMTEVISVFVPKEKNMYEIVLQKGIGVLSDKSKDLFKLMLSTFRFLPEVSPTPESAEGKFCGGIAANLPEYQCPPGYRCQLEGNWPDAGGKCVKK